jgi:hypothetical protein
VQVIDAGESRAARIPESHNYPGSSGIAGLEIPKAIESAGSDVSSLLARTFRTLGSEVGFDPKLT